MSGLRQTHDFEEPGKLKYRIINGQITREIVVHRFEIYGEEDPIVVAGKPLYGWEHSEAGQWVMEHAVEQPRWERFNNMMHFIDKFNVVARLSEPDITYFTLKYT